MILEILWFQLNNECINKKCTKSETKIDSGLLSASTIFTKEKCKAHSDDNKNNRIIFL